MSLTHWLSERLRPLCATRAGTLHQVAKGRARPLQRSFRPCLEGLEDRLTPSTLTVNTLADNTTDSSLLTLRDAIVLINNGGDPTALGQPSMPGAASNVLNAISIHPVPSQ